MGWTFTKRGLFAGETEAEGNEMLMMGNTENTPVHVEVQGKEHGHCEKNAHGGESLHMAPRDEDEGRRLDQVLAGRGLNRSKLAKRAGVSPSTVQKWWAALSRGDITESSWHSCATALSRVGIDPGEVRPGAKTPTKTRTATLIDPIMAVNDKATLLLFLEILTVEGQDDRDTLVALVNSKLARL